MPFPVDPKHVDRAEAKLSVRFPAAYREWLLRSNGGEIELRPGEFWELFPVMDDSDQKRLKRTWDDVVRQTEMARRGNRFLASAVAIGHDGEGNLLVLLPGEGADCEVAVWDHETGTLEIAAGDHFGAQ